jgi:hypothetical protein
MGDRWDNGRDNGRDRPTAQRTLEPQPAPPGIYASSYTPALAVAICERLAAGESLRSICREDPAMPTEKTVWNWARANPDFAAMKQWALDKARRASVAQSQIRQPVVRAAPRLYGAEIVERLCEQLGMGRTLAEVCRDDGMPAISTVYYWLRVHPEFVELYRAARDGAADYLWETALEAGALLGGGRRAQRIMRRAMARAGRITPWRLAAQDDAPAPGQPDGFTFTAYEDWEHVTWRLGDPPGPEEG